MAQLRAKALRDFGASLGPEAAHHIAVGAETLALRMERTAPTRWRWRRCWKPTSASPPSTTRACRRIRSTAWQRAVPRLRLAVQLRAEGRHRLLRLPEPPELAIPASNLGDTRTLVIPVAHTIFFEMGAERRASMGIAESLIRVSVGIEDTDDLLLRGSRPTRWRWPRAAGTARPGRMTWWWDARAASATRRSRRQPRRPSSRPVGDAAAAPGAGAGINWRSSRCSVPAAHQADSQAFQCEIIVRLRVDPDDS
jgi:hypothetical protein